MRESPGADVANAARSMVDERIHALPIVDGATVVGVITRRHLLRSSLIRDDELFGCNAIRALKTFGDPDRWTVTVQAAVVDVEDYRDRSDDRNVATAVCPPFRGSTTSKCATRRPTLLS